MKDKIVRKEKEKHKDEKKSREKGNKDKREKEKIKGREEKMKDPPKLMVLPPKEMTTQVSPTEYGSHSCCLPCHKFSKNNCGERKA